MTDPSTRKAMKPPSEPEYAWGESPAGIPAVVWQHEARPLWVQVVPSQDTALLIEKNRLAGRRISTGEILWEAPSAGPPDQLAVDGAGVLLASGQEVRGLDPRTGAERWRRQLGGDIEALAGGGRSAYAVSAQRSRGGIFALDRGSGEIRWRAPFGAEPELTPHEAAGVLLASDASTESIVALDMARGERLWEFAAEDQPVVAGPAAGDLVIVSAHAWGAAGLDLRAGAVRWRLESPRGFEAAGVTLGGRVYLTDGTLYAVDAASGRVVWKREPADEGDGVFSVYVEAGILFAETWRGRLLALDPATGSLRWERRFGQVQGMTSDGSSSAEGEGSGGHPARLYLRMSVERPHAPWGVLAVNPSTGALLWELQTRRMPPDLTVVGGILVVELKNQVLALRK